MLIKIATIFSALVLFVSIAVIIYACAPKTLAGTITVSSNSALLPLFKQLSAAFNAFYPDVNFAFLEACEADSLRQVAAGEANIGAISRQLKPEEIGLTEKLAARWTLAVLVHPSNTLVSLAGNQLTEIFNGKTGDWAQVGGIGSEIHVYYTDENSGAGRILGLEKISETAILCANTEMLKEAVASDAAGIACAVLSIPDTRIKVIEITFNEAKTPGAITLATLRLPVYMVTRNAPDKVIRAFLNFCLSPDGQKIVSDGGFRPVA